MESDQGGLDDDTALDGVRLECFDSKGVFTGYVSIISRHCIEYNPRSVESSPKYDHSGEWMSKQYCTSNSFLDGIRLRSEEATSNIHYLPIMIMILYRVTGKIKCTLSLTRLTPKVWMRLQQTT